MKPTVGQAMEGYIAAIRAEKLDLNKVGPDDLKRRSPSDEAVTDGATDWDYYCYRIVRGVLVEFGAAAVPYLHVAVHFSEKETIEGYQFASIKAKSWVIVSSGRRPRSERMAIQLGAMAAASLKVFHDTLRRHIAAADEFVEYGEVA